MDKYSKKLVSKCTYVQILKCTKTELLGQFMSAGGWSLVHNWLKDGSESLNWSFVQDILEVLLLCPVDALRLKSNQTPKIVKTLSLNCSHNTVKILSNKLVEQWLKIAHQEKHQQLLQNNSGSQQTSNGLNDTLYNNNLNNVEDKNFLVNNNDESVVKNEITEIHSSESKNAANVIADSEVLKLKSSENTVKYKISNKDTGLVLSIKRSTSPSIKEQDNKDTNSSDIKSSKSSSKSKSSSDKDKKKSSSSSSSSSSSHKTSKSSSHKDDKERSSHRSGSSSSRDKHSSSKHSSSRDKEREKYKEKRKKDVEKEQAEKDKETLNFLTPVSSIKMQRIPKRQLGDNSENKEEPSSKTVKTSDAASVVEKKKPSISIEVRKGDKPKTVKTINSQFRNHGLAEEPPPPPSRKALNKKPTNATVTPVLSVIAQPTSTSKLAISPTISKKIEKALEAEVPERVGGVKLIKPKREYNQILMTSFIYSQIVY